MNFVRLLFDNDIPAGLSIILQMKTKALCILVGAAIMALFSLFTNYTNRIETTAEETQAVNLPHSTYLPAIPDTITLFGELMPIDRQDVAESIEREMLTNTFWHTNTMLVIKRSKRIFDVIDPILSEMNIPSDFRYLAVAESNLWVGSKSPAGAVGLWQILETTGKELGLEINDEVDQRYDIEKSTYAACKFLKRAYDSLGSWALVAAAYNGGQGRVSKNKSNQMQDSYYDILWAEETARYVFRIAAFKIIMNDPATYGFNITDEDIYEPYPSRDTVVSTSIANIAQFAIDHNTTYKAMKNLNPWLRQNKLTNARGRSYTIKIPE